MLDFFPAQIGNMDQAIHAVFQFHEGTKIGQVANRALDFRTNGVLVFNLFPRVGLDLLHAE